MKQELDAIAEKVFNQIRSRFEDVTLGDENAKSTDDPGKARFFNFDYTDAEGHEFGNVTISIINGKDLVVHFGRNITAEMTPEEKDQWYKWLEVMRFFSMRQDLKWVVRDTTRRALRHRDIKHISKVERPYKTSEVSLEESKMFGSSRISYESLGSHKLIVKHAKRIDEERPGVRSRHIKAIYIENADGERFKSPSNSLTVSRAIATHLDEGGKLYDEVYEGICRYVDEMKKLGSFLRRAKNENYSDPEIVGVVKEAAREFNEGRGLLQRMARRKHYQECVSNLMERVKAVENKQDTEHLRTKFTKQVLDDRVSNALPTISKLYHQRNKNKKTLIDKQKWLFDKNLINEVARSISMYESALSYKSMESMVEHVLENLSMHLHESGQDELVEFADRWKSEYGQVADSLEKQLVSRFVLEVYRAAKSLPAVKDDVVRPKKDIINELVDEEFKDGVDVEKLQKIFDSPLEIGPDGMNAAGALEEIFSQDVQDKLQDMLYKESKDDPDADARPLIKYWLMDNYSDIYDELDFSNLENQPPEQAEEPAAEAPPQPAAPPAPAAEAPPQPAAPAPAAEQPAAEMPSEPGQETAAPPAPGEQDTAMADLQKLAGI